MPAEHASQGRRISVHGYADLAPVLDPASIALVGASARAGSFGDRVLSNLAAFTGRVDLVNPRAERIGDRPCFPSISALPEVPDCAVLAVARDAVEEIVLECADRGVRGAIVFASGYAETGKPERAALQARLAAIARERGIRIVGPNCIGVLNFASGAGMTFSAMPRPVPPRPHAVGVVSQSGALGFALSQAVERGVSLSHVLTSGNSCDVDMADYVAYLAEDPNCRAIACLFEGMATPLRLVEAAERAWEADKPLVVYKMATGAEGARAAMSHTGSLAGSDAAYAATLRRAGAVLVDKLEALVETAAFFAKAPRPKAKGVAVVATSGGAAIMAADKAELHGVPLPQPEPATAAVLEARIPEYGSPRNPCDVTAQVLTDPNSLRECAGALLADPNFGALVVPHAYAYQTATVRLPVFSELAAANRAIVCNVWMPEWLGGPGARESEADPNIALFHSMDRCFATLAAWHRRAARRQASPSAAARRSPLDAAAAAGAMLRAAPERVLTEREAKAALALYGIPVVREALASDADAAVTAASALGYPVALKVESPDIPHKTEAGVIRLDLRDAAAVRAAFADIVARAEAIAPKPRVNGVLVQPMVPAGVELIVGGRSDPLFGPLIVVGLGGILVELLRDSAVMPAPVTPDEAEAMLRGLKGFGPLAAGFRGAAPIAVPVLAEIISRLSEFLADQAEAVAELDVNPLICAGERVVAVDALILRRGSGRDPGTGVLDVQSDGTG